MPTGRVAPHGDAAAIGPMSSPCACRAVTIQLFGPIAISHGDRKLGPRDLGGSRPKQVLEILLAARGASVPVDRIAEMLWGEKLPDNACGSLQTFVSVLRRHLCPDPRCARELIVTERGAYRFAVGHADLDLDRFDQLLERAGRVPTEAARRCLAESLSLATHEVLEDEPYADWAQELRGLYRGRVIGAYLEAADAALATHDYRAGLTYSQAATRLDGFSERAHRSGMLALYAMGRAHEALEAYRRLRSVLVGELGLDPSVETRALEAAILRQDEAAGLLPRPAREIELRAPGQPWMLFLGRKPELTALEELVRSALGGEFSLVLVEGEAGLGKSRLLEEFVSTLDGVRVGRAKCSALERRLAYVPLAGALRDALSGVELDPAQLPALRGVLPELGVRQPAVEFGEVDVLEAMVTVITRYAPMVLILDDLHLADHSTIAALEYLHRRCAESPVVVLGAMRGEDTASDHPLRGLPTTEIRLEPLTGDELSPLGISGVHERTGGHPTLVADLIANGSRPDLRRSLAELLTARCRAEGTEAYRILLMAATLPQPFDPEVLAALLQADPVELTERLEQLCDRRILRIDGFRFRYRYAIVRDVLAANVSPARGRLLRARAETVRERQGIFNATGHDVPVDRNGPLRSVRS
jgi:DNA-binding SARP family transcriptional activator